MTFKNSISGSGRFRIRILYLEVASPEMEFLDINLAKVSSTKKYTKQENSIHEYHFAERKSEG